MKEGPDIARIGSLIGDPARANILTALMSGKALTATELAGEAGVTLQTASSHLSKLEEAALIFQRKQGRHRYYTLADDEVGSLLEAMMGFAAKRGLLRTRTGPADGALRKARICYDHLAGELGVSLFNTLAANCYIEVSDDEVMLTRSGSKAMSDFGIDLDMLATGRRPLCKSCLDWSERRTHLAGALGSALLDRFYELGWASRKKNSRVIVFTHAGEAALANAFGIKP